MRNRMSDELALLTIKLMNTSNERELTRIADNLKQLIDTAVKEKKTVIPALKSQELWGKVVIFKKEDLKDSDKGFKKEFIKNRMTANMARRMHGKGYLCYDIWYRSDRYYIFVTSIDLDEVKKQFIEMTKPENIKKAIRVGGINV